MRLRLLAFVPPAALITGALLVSASSLVSALETSFTPTVSSAIEITRFVSRCDELDQEIDALSRAATSCDQDLQCLRSPILCPISMDERMARDYRALREERREQCDSGFSQFQSPVGFSSKRPSDWNSDSPPRTSSTHSNGGVPFESVRVDASECPSSPGGLEHGGTSEYNEPATFVF